MVSFLSIYMIKEAWEILWLGKLDDSPGEDNPRERFRSFLKKDIKEVGQIRDYIYECLRNSGPQYNRALQDLVNHLGTFLGFEVTFGRYQGVHGEIGFDGHWKSPTKGKFQTGIKQWVYMLWGEQMPN